MNQRFLLSVMFSCLGIVLGFYVNKIADKIIEYKGCKNPLNSRFYLESNNFNISIVCSIVLFLLFFVDFYFYNFTEAIFLMFFIIIAVLGTLIDIKVRIIPNELVLILFVVGIAYNVMIGGWRILTNSISATLFTIMVFALSALITRKIKGIIGVGAGDIKLAMVIAFTVGFGRVYIFLIGIVFAVLLYIFIGIMLKRLTVGSSFPMCGPIMFGFLVALYWQVINYVYIRL